MAIIESVNGITPNIKAACFIAKNSTIIGQVTCKENSSFWYNAVIRGDVGRIVIGHHTNIQDGAVLHCTYKKSDLIIGNHVSIGHNAIVHGCTIGNHVLVGMGAIVMDNALIEDNVIIAAGAVVLAGTTIQSGEIYAGVPAKKVKQRPSKDIQKELHTLSLNYVKYSSWINQ